MTKSNKKSKTTTEKERDYTPVRRAGHALLWAGNLAIAVYLAILVSSPDTGQYILAGVACVSAIYYFVKLLK